jgi:hypothetical protein
MISFNMSFADELRYAVSDQKDKKNKAKYALTKEQQQMCIAKAETFDRVVALMKFLPFFNAKMALNYQFPEILKDPDAQIPLEFKKNLDQMMKVISEEDFTCLRDYQSGELLNKKMQWHKPLWFFLGQTHKQLDVITKGQELHDECKGYYAGCMEEQNPDEDKCQKQLDQCMSPWKQELTSKFGVLLDPKDKSKGYNPEVGGLALANDIESLFGFFEASKKSYRDIIANHGKIDIKSLDERVQENMEKTLQIEGKPDTEALNLDKKSLEETLRKALNDAINSIETEKAAQQLLSE